MMKILSLLCLLFASVTVFGQCPDGPAIKYKQLAEENNSTGNYDSRGQAYTQAAIYEMAVCACLSGQLDPRANVASLKAKANASKEEALRLKPSLTLRSWPAKCKFKSAAGGATKSMANQSSYDQAMQTYRNAMKGFSMVERSRKRAAHIARELNTLSSIGANQTPEQIMQQYHQNRNRIDEINRQLKESITRSNLQGGLTVLQDVQSGNSEGAVYGVLGMVGKLYEDQEAKKNVANQREALIRDLKNKMLKSAREMYQANIEKKEQFLAHAATVLEKDRETFYLRMADYFGAYASYIDSNFSYSHTNWSSYDKEPPAKTAFGPKQRNPSSADYAAAAERKYALYQENGEEIILEGAIKLLHAAIHSDASNPDYYARLGVIAMDYKPSMALSSYLSAIELDEDLANTDTLQSLKEKLYDEFYHNYYTFNYNFAPGSEHRKYISQAQLNDIYHEPLDFFRSTIEEKLYLLPFDGVPLIVHTATWDNGDLFEQILEMIPPLEAQQEQKLYTQMLHFAAKNNSIKNLEFLIEKGADVDYKIDGKNAIEVALENNSDKIYPLLIAKSTDKSRYKEQYKGSFMEALASYKSSTTSKQRIDILKGLTSKQVQMEMAKWLIREKLGDQAAFDTEIGKTTLRAYYEAFKEEIDQSPEKKAQFMALLDAPEAVSTAELVAGLDAVKENKYSYDFQVFLEKEFIKQMILETSEKAADLISANLLMLPPNLDPSDNLLSVVPTSRKSELRYFKDKECLRCYQTIPMGTIYRAIKEYREQNGGKVGKIWEEAFDNFTKHGELSISGDFQAQIFKYYNRIAPKTGYPIAHEYNKYGAQTIARPVDYRTESYAHIALLQDNYKVFRILSEKFDLPELKNDQDKSITDYLYQLTKEKPSYVKYMALPAIASHINWKKTINGQYPLNILISQGYGDLIENIDLNKVVLEEGDKMVWKLAKDGHFKAIGLLSQNELIDINKQDPANGYSVLHYFVDYIHDNEMLNDFGRYSEQFPTLELAKKEYGLSSILSVDKKIKDHDRNTAYDLLKAYYKAAESGYLYIKPLPPPSVDVSVRKKLIEKYMDPREAKKIQKSRFKEWKSVLR